MTRLPAWVTLVAATVFCSVAAASPEGGHGAHEGIKWWGGATEDDPRIGLAFLLINFIVLLVILNKILFKNLRQANREKSDAIKLELERATQARAEAESVLKVYESKLEALESEVEDIRAQAKRTAERDRERILADAADQAEKIRKNAEATAEREALRRRHEIEHEVIDRALAKAEEAIRRSFGDADQRRLVDDYVAGLADARLDGGASEARTR